MKYKCVFGPIAGQIAEMKEGRGFIEYEKWAENKDLIKYLEPLPPNQIIDKGIYKAYPMRFPHKDNFEEITVLIPSEKHPTLYEIFLELLSEYEPREKKTDYLQSKVTELEMTVKKLQNSLTAAIEEIRIWVDRCEFSTKS